MNKVVNIGMWVVLIGSVYFIITGVVTGTFGDEKPEDGVLVVVAILIASTLFTLRSTRKKPVGIRSGTRTDDRRVPCESPSRSSLDLSL